MNDIHKVEDGLWEGYEVPDYIHNEENWKLGFHITKSEKRIEIKEISDFHLKNIIEYFRNENDVTPLLKEAKRRLSEEWYNTNICRNIGIGESKVVADWWLSKLSLAKQEAEKAVLEDLLTKTEDMCVIDQPDIHADGMRYAIKRTIENIKDYAALKGVIL